jgi:glutamyl-Q tRNA(Asp) synthetase
VNSAVVGRFAPTPSGPLHFGSVVTAVASFLDARSLGGRWLVRIDDLDPPRIVAGAETQILTTLAALALEWDGAVVRQSARGEAYRAALASLIKSGIVFACRCSRRAVGRRSYPGTCRGRTPQAHPTDALRIRVRDETLVFQDRVQGEQRENLARTCGDFVVRRADGVYAYHLAAALDDAWQGVTHITRGADLLDSTMRQIYVQAALGLARPIYAHLPVVLDRRGDKLSKQTHAPAVSAPAAGHALYHALSCLDLAPPRDAYGAPPQEMLAWALAHWRLATLKRAARYYPYTG